MNPTYEAYRTTRLKYPMTSALNAYRIAKAPAVPSIDWKDVNHGQTLSTATWLQSGYVVIATQHYDEDMDMSWNGYFSNHADTVDAIRHDPVNHRSFDWWNPTISYKEMRGAFTRTHCKADVHNLTLKAIRAGYKLACDQGDGWSPIYITVEVKRAGITLGEASCGGYIAKWGASDEDYINEETFQLVNEAIFSADEVINKLCKDSMAWN